MRMVTFGIAAVFAALVLQGSLTSEAAEKSQKGQTQKQHYGCGLDVAVVDGQPASTKRKAKSVKAKGGPAKQVKGEVFVKLPRAR